MESSEISFHVFIFHAFSFSLYASNMFYERYYVATPGSETYAGRWKFLTFWNEVLQCIYFMSATFGDMFFYMKKQKKEKSSGRSRDFLFATLAFPVAMLVSVMFWGIYAIDRELIYPVFLDKIIPNLVNHILHTACALLMILEAFIVHHEYPASKTGVLTIFFFALLYFLWMAWQAIVLSMWPYTFLNNFSIFHRCVFFFICYGQLCLFYFAGRYITSLRMKSSNGPAKLKV